MNLPRRRKPQPLGVKEAPQIRNASHLKWCRGHECTVANGRCEGKIEAAHVRIGTDGNLGTKPSDCWVIPLCSFHHRQQHDIGEPRFQYVYSINMHAIAKALWDKSPHRHKSEQS